MPDLPGGWVFGHVAQPLPAETFYLLTEEGDRLTTEDGDPLVLEEA
jgi:hypothetical protein